MRAEESEAAEAVARAQLQRLCAFGFARSRCIARLAEATEGGGGGGGGGDCEEVALAALLRETLENLATTLPSAMPSAVNGPGQVAPTVAQDGASASAMPSVMPSAMTSATAAGRMAAARAASARLAGLERLRRLVLAPEIQSEPHEMQSELLEIQAEEESALGAILGPEFRQTAGGSVLTLLWDASTGEPLIASDCV